MMPNRTRRFVRRAWNALGVRARSRAKAVCWRWKSMGTGVRFGRNVFVDHPHRVAVGDHVVFGNNVEINNSAESEVVIGPGTVIDSNTVINVNQAGRLVIGASSKINKFNFISCNNEIRIGDNVMTAAFCHILDSNHGVAKGQPMRQQKKTMLTTRIGDDVWIGTMCTVLAGSDIGDGVVVGSNSTTRNQLEAYGIYAGNPAQRIRTRA